MNAFSFTLFTTKSKSPSLSKSAYEAPLEKLGWSKPHDVVSFLKSRSP